MQIWRICQKQESTAWFILWKWCHWWPHPQTTNKPTLRTLWLSSVSALRTRCVRSSVSKAALRLLLIWQLCLASCLSRISWATTKIWDCRTKEISFFQTFIFVFWFCVLTSGDMCTTPVWRMHIFQMRTTLWFCIPNLCCGFIYIYISYK
jgi:hypothetical protein